MSTYTLHIRMCRLSFSMAFQADFFNFSCTFNYESNSQQPTHVLFIFIFIYFSFVNEKKSNRNQQQTSQQASKRTERANQRLSEWVSEQHTLILNHWQKISIVFANTEAIAISQVFITFMSFPSFYWTKLIRFDSIRLGIPIYTEMQTPHTSIPTRTHTHTGQAFNADIDTIFSLHRLPPLHGAALATKRKSLTCVLECLLWNWPCSWS